MLLCYLYLNKGSYTNFWMLMLGGIEVRKSMYILYVVIYIFPDFLFYYCICSRYITQLKENYVYIFVREKNIKNWLQKFVVISLLDIILYEIITTGILFLAGKCLQEKLAIQALGFIIIILCNVIKLVFIVIFCYILLIKFNEIISVYANLMAQALPVFFTGVLYDIDKKWEMAIKYIPFNWCNYNYMMAANIKPVAMLCLLFILTGIMYLYLEKLFSNYEAI